MAPTPQTWTEGYAAGTDASDPNITVNVPTGTVNGEGLLAVGMVGGGRTFSGQPAGWDLLFSGTVTGGTGGEIYVWVKTAADEAPWTWTVNNAFGPAGVWVTRISDAADVTDIVPVVAGTLAGTTGGTVTCPSALNAEADSLVFRIAVDGRDQDSFSPNATELFETKNAAADKGICVAYHTQALAGDTGTDTIGFLPTWHNVTPITIAFAPPASGATDLVITNTSHNLLSPEVTVVHAIPVVIADTVHNLLSPQVTVAADPVISDTFTEPGASTQDLSTHVTDTGHSWSSLAGVINVNQTLDEAVCSGTGIYRVGHSLGPDHYAEVTITNHNINAGLLFGYSDVADSGYMMTADKNNQRLNVHTRTTGGTPVVIAFGAHVFPASFTIRATKEGELLRGYVDDVLVVETADSTFAAGTHVGIWGNSNNRFDNLSAGIIEHAIELVSPVSKTFYQRRWQTDNTADIPFEISLNRPATINVEARLLTATHLTWQQVAGPSPDGPLVGTLLNQPQGDGTLQFRLDGDDSTIREQPRIRITDVWAIGGQSNAMGQGSANQNPALTYVPGNFDKVDLAFEDGADPWHPLGAGSCYPWMAREYEASQDLPFCTLSGAANGSRLLNGEWQPGGTPYEEFVAMVEAYTAETGSQVRGILWYQGESEAEIAIPSQYDTYKAALKGLITNLRSENAALADAVMIVTNVGQTSSGTSLSNSIIKHAQLDAVLEQPATLKMGGMTYDTAHADGLHWGNGSSLEVLGKRRWISLEDAIFNGTDEAPSISGIEVRPGGSVLRATLTGDVIDPGIGGYTVAAWRVYDDGVAVTIDSIDFVDATTIDITLAAPINDGSVITVDGPGYGNDSAGATVPLSTARILPSTDVINLPIILAFGEVATPTLNITSTVHNLLSPEVTVTYVIPLDIASTSHALTTQHVTIVVAHVLDIANTVHVLTSQHVTVTYVVNLTIDDTVHNLLSPLVTLSIPVPSRTRLDANNPTRRVDGYGGDFRTPIDNPTTRGNIDIEG